MIKLLYKSSCSACFEWDNDLSYYNDATYTVTLNKKAVLTSDLNVFSLFGLLPSTRYELGIEGSDFNLTFTTDKETVCVTAKSFGAKGTGKCDDTLAIQTAINCLPEGGRLKIEKGVYLIAPINLKSNITIELCKGAVLLGNTNEKRYPVIPGEVENLDKDGDFLECGTWEGLPRAMHQALVFGAHVSNVNIVGEGVIDGNAQNSTWWQNVQSRKIGRPRLCFLNDCKDVTFHGVMGQNAASWQFHPYFSKNVSFYGITVNAPKISPNTDGLDPESCSGVNIIGCHFSVGDDCIAIKSGKSPLFAKRHYQPAEKHVIRNCLMENGHGAITLGSEMSAGVKDLTVSKCLFLNTDRGLRIKTRRGRGNLAVIDDVVFDNIKMADVLTPIVINMYYFCCDPDRYSEYVWSRQALPVDDRTPYLGKFVFKNMVCTNCHVAACYCDGLSEAPIKEITLENVVFEFAENAKEGKPSMATGVKTCSKKGMYFYGVESLNLVGVSLKGVTGDEVITEKVGRVVRR